MEDYAAKMAGKTDAELLLYVERRAEYREQAVLAALSELERRGRTIDNVATLRTELQASLVKTEAEARLNPAPEPTWATKATEPEEIEEVAADAPALYSPTTVVVFSVFSFLIGGVLMLLNLLRLRRYGGAALLVALVALGISGLSWMSGLLEIRPEYVFLGINVVLAALYVYVLWPYFIGAQAYRPRGWLMPLLIIFALNMLFMLLLRYAGVAVPGLSQ
ncbi:hypothetical protein [Solirubrum puertoriconensis]|uniref:Uncharacterized protein n=1 Tax=Solirubrum puertoriconensis TaxID=1751427 RepID=A0A9X0L352_SOLP1|nr:hypothetical protein [Solirubrum puertoriconensis]KUG06096.1 hypothetical protein ASU33_01645 [Solirubrum puertoriconensis]